MNALHSVSADFNSGLDLRLAGDLSADGRLRDL